MLRIVTRRGQLVLEHYAGACVPSPGAEAASVTRETLFFGSSLAKTIVAMIVMTLVESGQILLEDLDSVNGTSVNKQRLSPRKPHPIKHGDELRFGKLVLVYMIN